LAVLLLGAACVLGTSPAAGQALARPRQPLDSIRVDQRVRITAPSAGLSRATGRVSEVSHDAFVVHFDAPDRSQSVARSAIAELDVMTGYRSRVVEGIALGLLVGGGIGFLIGASQGGDECSPGGMFSSLCFSAAEKGALLGLGLGLAGAGLGAGVGRSLRREVWRPASVGPVAVTLVPFWGESTRGLQVGITRSVR
jgi:hypothetical protein